MNLGDYYRDSGDSTKAEIEYLQWDKDFPENYVVFKLDSLVRVNKRQEAIEYVRWAIKKNPAFATAYYALGKQYLNIHNTDSAIFYLEIAITMNPYNAVIMNALGYAYTDKGEYKKAEQILNRSIELDNSSISPYLDLLQMYAKGDKHNKYDSLLSVLAERNDVTPKILARFAAILFDKGELESGRKSLEKAIAKGLDSVYIRKLEERYPQLKLKINEAPEDSL